MSTFTTRPDIRGTFGAVISTHWIASAIGMAVLEKGGKVVSCVDGPCFARIELS
jgi:gamma-glutamyltranspeptidase